VQNVLWNTSRYNKYFAEFFLLMVLSKMFAITQFICPVNFQLLHHIPVYKISTNQQFVLCIETDSL